MDVVKKNIFLTGSKKVGKTTLINALLPELPRVAGGFFTEAILGPSGEREGFQIRLLDGTKQMVAHKKIRSSLQFGHYYVNKKAFETFGVNALEEALASSGFVIMDEIGRMEIWAPLFQKAILRILNSPTHPVIGTLQPHDTPLLNTIRSRSDVAIVTVTLENRAEILSTVRAMLGNTSAVLS